MSDERAKQARALTDRQNQPATDFNGIEFQNHSRLECSILNFFRSASLVPWRWSNSGPDQISSVARPEYCSASSPEGFCRPDGQCIRDKPIAPGSPWQNGFAERLIGSIRRECVDHIVVLGEAHLRRTLQSYARYYNESRVHRSLNKDAPFHRVIERLGAITSTPVLGGLHHQIAFMFNPDTGLDVPLQLEQLADEMIE